MTEPTIHPAPAPEDPPEPTDADVGEEVTDIGEQFAEGEPNG